MDKALYGSINGRQVTPSEFVAQAPSNYKKVGIFPYCEACHEIVHVYGVHNPNPKTVQRFDHANRDPNADPLDDCILAKRNNRFQGMQPSGYDDDRGIVIRRQFFDEEIVKTTYSFCHKLCRKNNLPLAKFRSMIQRADRKRIWAYADIQTWAIPYILLTLVDIDVENENNNDYSFHFIFDKASGTNIDSIWQPNSQRKLVKVFTGSGKPVQTDDNPIPISEEILIMKAGNTEWVRGHFLQALMNLE